MCALLLAATSQAAPQTAPDAARGVAVRLIGFNDFHGHLEAGNNALTLPDPRAPGQQVRVGAGGAASLAGLIGQLRGEAAHSVVFSSGDLIGAAPLVSSLFRHETTIAAMNAIGLDFAITGNHEFDAGFAELRRIAGGGCADDAGADGTTLSCADGRFAGARFAYLAANVEGPDGKPVLPPTWIKTIDGVKIGFIGVVTRTTPGIVMPSGIARLQFRDEAGTLNRHAGQLQRQGVQAIVAVVHEGGTVDADWNDTRCAGAQGRIFEIARALAPSIDLVFSAHTHQGYHCVIDTPHQRGLHVLQATSFGRAVAMVDVVIDRRTGDIDRSQIRGLNLPVVSTPDDRGAYARVPEDAAIARLVQAAVARAAPRADRPVGSIAARIERGARGDAEAADSPAGRLIADAQLAATRGADRGGAQIAFMNTGGIRASLACPGAGPCPVTYGQVFTMQPFGNSLVVMTLTGRQLKAVLEDQHKPHKTAPHFLQVSQGLRYTWARQAKFGERVRDLRLDGRPVAPEARYRVAVNSYLAEGGDGFARLRDGTDRRGGPLDVDALADYLRSHPGYAPDPLTRITLVD